MANLLFDTLFNEKPPERTCIELTDGTRMSYGELDAATARAAAALTALGVEPGDRVAAQVDKSVAALVLYLATIRAGAVFLPLNTGYTSAEVEYFVNDASPALLVCRPESESALQPLAQAAGARLRTLDAGGSGGSWPQAVAEAGSGAPEPAPRDADDLAGILYTSGTTGRAKGAMLTQRNLASNALTLVECWRFNADDVLIHALPIFHTHGLFVAVHCVMVAGASMIFLPRFDAAEVLSLMPRATVLMGVPTFYTRLLAEPGLDAGATANMRLFISGSAPLLEETHREFQQRTGHAILERYGMTETSMNTSNPYDGERRAGTVGPPLPDVEVRVTDPETGKPLPPGEVGQLEVRGPNVFKGYWQMPDKTREEFRDDGFFITGDMGLIDEQGYVSIVGRSKDLIISGGYNVYPKEVENEIDALPGVVESAVIGVPHPDFGEAVVAVVVPEKGARLDEGSLVAPLADRLARYKQPKKVVFVDALPRNTMGKVQKNLLREQYRDVAAR
ncbi:MAG TPA: malonyl-CoA synthase [Arenicellales bacterium]|nr:malonyl-CoA synthase [Arenicellales bacterium]